MSSSSPPNGRMEVGSFVLLHLLFLLGLFAAVSVVIKMNSVLCARVPVTKHGKTFFLSFLQLRAAPSEPASGGEAHFCPSHTLRSLEVSAVHMMSSFFCTPAASRIIPCLAKLAMLHSWCTSLMPMLIHSFAAAHSLSLCLCTLINARRTGPQRPALFLVNCKLLFNALWIECD